MSRLSRSSRLLRNAEAALLSAIEIYNKPTFAYREETFAILAINAWELLIKAKLLAVSNNQQKCLYVTFSPKTKTGTPSKKLQFKRNRSGNLMTMGIDGCIVALEKKGVIVPAPIKKNLEALTEIRDNAVHCLNASPVLAKQVLEIGTAAVRKFHRERQALARPRPFCVQPLPDADRLSAFTVRLHRDHGVDEERKIVSYLAALM